MNTPKQKLGEGDKHYYNRCCTPEKEVSDCKCRKCGAVYESDGENDNGLCFECDQ